MRLKNNKPYKIIEEAGMTPSSSIINAYIGILD